MKIIFTGGGTGGHFYPLIAVAESIISITRKDNIVKPKLYYMSTSSFDETALYENDIHFIKINSGKMRVGKGNFIRNSLDLFKVSIGTVKAFFILINIYPDVIFSKGGYGAVPTLLAGRILRIPIVIHDSDSVPGRTTLWSAKFAKKIALSYPEAEKFIPKEYKNKVALIGNLVRSFMFKGEIEGAREKLDLNEEKPVLLLLGGSLGARSLNNFYIELLPQLIEKFQVIHQTGQIWYKDVIKYSTSILKNNLKKSNYRPIPYLDQYYLRLVFSASDIIVSRGGSGSLTEIAAFGKPSIIIPLSEKISRDQKDNAYSFSKVTDAIVIEEKNLKSSIFIAQLDKLIEDKKLFEHISKKTKLFTRPAAANKLARAILDIAIIH